MKEFDTEKFRDKMESIFGGQFYPALIEITGASRSSVLRWVSKKKESPHKGPKPEYQEAISKKIKEEYGETIMWGDFMSSTDDEKKESITDELVVEDIDLYKELISAKEEINRLTNLLFEKEQENILLKSQINKMRNVSQTNHK